MTFAISSWSMFRNFTDAPSFSLTDALKGQTGGSGSDIFQTQTNAPEKQTEGQLIEDLINNVKAHVGTAAEWTDNLSVINAYHGQLLVAKPHLRTTANWANCWSVSARPARFRSPRWKAVSWLFKMTTWRPSGLL